MSESIVVYLYTDPAFRRDISGLFLPLRAREHRLIEGGDLNELLLLLEVGRPTAIVAVVGSADLVSSAPYQMVMRRSLGKLIPIIQFGPEDPRDGAILYYPEGPRFALRHMPAHALAEMIESLAKDPPTPPQRATRTSIPAFASDRKPGGERLQPVPAASTAESIAEAAVIAAESPKPAPPEAPIPAAPARQPPPEPGPAATERPVSRDTSPQMPLPAWWRAAAIASAAAIVLAVGAVLLVVLWPSGGGPFGPRGERTSVMGGTAWGQPGDRPGAADGTGPGRPEGSGAGGALDAPAHPLPAGVEQRYPAFFRPGSALFWITDPVLEAQILAGVRALRPGRVARIVGHATTTETESGLTSLGLSRAWAVSKYLAKLGIPPDLMETEQGKPVPPVEEVDDRGYPRNRWVGVVVE